MNKKNKFSFVVVIFIVGFLIAAYIIYLATKEAYRNREINNEIAELKSEAERIRSNNELLREKIGYFETDEFKEKIAKEKLNLKKEDEEVVVIKQSPVQAENNSLGIVEEQQSQDESNIPIYIKWWRNFFRY